MRARATTVKTQLARRIRELREVLSFTQEALAKEAGISISYMSMIERAQRLPHIETLAVLAKALGLTLSQLFLDVNGARTKDAQAEDLPLLAYLGNLRLRPADVDALLKVAKAIFDGRP